MTERVAETRERLVYLANQPAHADGDMFHAVREFVYATDDLLARVSSLETALAEAEADLRREWWLNHGCEYPAMYGDDGEMMCANGRPHHLPLDFKRQPLAELREAVRNARLSRGAALAGVSDGPTEPQPHEKDLGVASPTGSARCSNPGASTEVEHGK